MNYGPYQRTVLATGLSFATSLRMRPDGALYVSNFGFGPPGQGEIVKITFWRHPRRATSDG